MSGFTIWLTLTFVRVKTIHMATCDLDNARQLNFMMNLSENGKERLRSNTIAKKVRKGTVIFSENELLQSLFCIKQGACKFSVIDDRGKEIVTHLLGEGDLMGRRAMLTKKGALVTATAIADTTLCCIDNESFSYELSRDTNFCVDMLKGFTIDEEERHMRMGLYENRRGIKNRLAGLLLYLNKKFGIATDGYLSVSLKREDMANVLGTSSEYVISLLAKLKRQGVIRLQKGRIKIISDLKLRRLL